MRTPFYNTEERRAALVAEARSWLGTPFSENCAVKGPAGGIDCVHYLAACHAAAGACAPVELPVQPVEHVRHWHEHHAESLILEWLGRPEVRGRVRRLDDGEPMMIGDMPLLEVQRTTHHATICCGPELLHVAIPAGVVSHSTRDRELMKKIRCVYRLFGEK